MTRKDTILIAVVINAGLLAILFMAAVIYDTDISVNQMAPSVLVDSKPLQVDSQPNLIAAVSEGDEVDQVLKYYSPQAVQSILSQSEKNEMSVPQIASVPFRNDSQPSEASSHEDFVSVKVKKGDMLEKIARAHKISVAEIKKANDLVSEHLSIGQVLKIPLKAKDSQVTSPNLDSKPQEKIEEDAIKENAPVYYVIKSGDNPWKIAKSFGVKYDEILRLNHLDEEKARNLKIGDRIRVK